MSQREVRAQGHHQDCPYPTTRRGNHPHANRKGSSQLWIAAGSPVPGKSNALAVATSAQAWEANSPLPHSPLHLSSHRRGWAGKRTGAI